MTETARRLVVVDASPAARGQLVQALVADGDVTVVREASTVAEAIGAIDATRPDVVVLDLHLTDGLQVVERIMAFTPTPILLLSSDRESADVGAALVAGAVDVLRRPERWDDRAGRELRSRVRIVAGVAVVRHRRGRDGTRAERTVVGRATTIVGIGASTGGPAALAEVLSGLDGIGAAVLVVQHLHDDFVEGLVSWMDRVSPLRVEVASDRSQLRVGVALIAPGGVHLRLGPDDELVLDPKPDSLHRPSVDVLFTSMAARRAGRNVGVLLTGMGEDGARGLLALRRRGDVTIVQDESTSVVFGMPRAAQRLGAAAHVLPLAQVAPMIVRSVAR